MSHFSVPTLPVLDVLCPMHLRIGPTGHIVHTAPSLRKLRPSKRWEGERFLEVFRLMRPREVSNMEELWAIAGRTLHFELRDPPRTGLKGVAVPDGPDGGMIVNVSFGISILEAVQTFSLNHSDFAPTDMASEMMYLIEAKSAAMEATRKLNRKLQKAKREAERKAYTDALTGLANRRALELELSNMVAARVPLALMQIDLDFFKAVNDTLGHAAGDFVLSEVSAALRSCTRSTDLVARIGGDEFVVIFEGIQDEEALLGIGHRIIEQLEIPRPFKGDECRISGSIGTVIWDGVRATSTDTLLDDADIALYASKNAGRGRQTFYRAEMRESSSEGGVGVEVMR